MPWLIIATVDFLIIFCHSIPCRGCVLLLQIPDDFEGYPLNMFCLPLHYVDKVDSVLIPKGIIMDRYDIHCHAALPPWIACISERTLHLLSQAH